jgi:hypothetical protein
MHHLYVLKTSLRIYFKLRVWNFLIFFMWQHTGSVNYIYTTANPFGPQKFNCIPKIIQICFHYYIKFLRNDIFLDTLYWF